MAGAQKTAEEKAASERTKVAEVLKKPAEDRGEASFNVPDMAYGCSTVPRRDCDVVSSFPTYRWKKPHLTDEIIL